MRRCWSSSAGSEPRNASDRWRRSRPAQAVASAPVASRRPYLVDLVRSAGGLLLALGALVLLTRKSSSDFARALVVGVPAIVLYMMSVLAPPAGEGDRRRPWRALLAITSILLAPVAMLELLHWLGADAGADLWLAAVFAMTALLAIHAARGTNAPYLALLAALSALVSWLYLWNKLANPSLGTTRWLLIAAAVLLFVLAVVLARRGAAGVREVATAGGLAAVLPGVIGVIAGFLAEITDGLVGTTSHGSERVFPLLSPTGRHTRLSGLETFGWDLYLLIASMLLVWVASRVRSRGLGYVGGLGIVTFLVSVGAQVTRLETGRAPQTGIGGWPIVLIVIGGAALLAPVLLRREP
jgi:hypothetical protein